MELSSQRLDEVKKLKLDEYARLLDIRAARIKDETRNVRSLRLGSTQKDANKKLQQEFRELQIQHFQMKEQYDDLQEKLKFFTKESALDFTEFELTELEDALVLVKQKKQRAMQEPDFLQRVDAEINQDLSASVLPLTTPKINQTPNEMQKNRPDVSLSKSKERTGNSLDWSNNSKQDSKQDSKDIPLGNNHLIDTVKKRPPKVPVKEVAPSSQHILQGAVSLFTGCLLENVEETNELDQSVYNFELGADALQQLDANFADLDRERSSTDEGSFSDDENFDFDAEPMFALPDRKINIVGENGHHVSLVSKRDGCQAGSNSDSIYFREQEQTREACNSKIYKEEGRHSSCHTFEKDVNHLQHLRNSLNDISASVLPLTTPKINQMEKNRPDASLSKSKERTGNSLDWSNNSRQDSKQDSKDIPLGNNHLIDTVKKRPPQVPVQKVAPSSQHILRGAVSLFTGCLLENVEETNELDQSVYNFELGADVLQQLDANFADLGDRERSFTDEDRFSDDENFDFDAEPMFALPDRKINIVGENGHRVSLVSKRDGCQAGSNSDSIYFREQEQTREACNSKIHKEEGRHSSCHTSEKDVNHLQHLRNSLNDISASVLPLTTPKINQMEKNRPDVSLSKSKERTGNSLDWSNNSRQDSKQDSKDIPLGNNHLIDTVKKRPPQVPVQKVAPSSQHILRGAVSLFTGCLLENVEETNELDQSVYNFELGADVLQQLDANFADLGDRERSFTDEDRFSDDENFDFDAEPMFALPDRKINII